MARFSIRRALGNLIPRPFRRQPPPQPPQPPQPPRPPQPPQPPPGGGEPGFARYTSIWHATVPGSVTEEIHDRTGYSPQEIIQAQLVVFLSHPGVLDEDRSERYRLWREYLKYMVVGGYSREERRRFFADYGIDPDDFGWAEWRAAIGYSRRG